MEISNSVLQSLSGFKDVSAAMGQFLDNATPESRDNGTQKLTEQRIAPVGGTYAGDTAAGSWARVTAEASSTPSQPSSIASAASDAVPMPASRITGTSTLCRISRM